MAGSAGPDLVQNGLVLALDAADKNSCGGQPTTNLLTYSNALNNAIWAGYCGPVSNITYNTTDITDPIGTNTAIKIARNNQNGCFTVGDVSMGLHYNPGANILTVGKTYTVSIYARGASGGEYFSYGLNDTHMVDTTLTTTWTRYTTTFTNITNATRGIQFYNSTASSQVYYVWGLQTQEGSVVGPYVASGASNGTANLNWFDLSGNANNGVFTNAPSFNNSNGGTISFDGVDDYVVVSDNSLLDIAGDKTLACWVNLGSNPGGICIAGKVSNSALGMALAYSWDSKGFQAIAWNSTNSPQLDKDLNRDINKWVYVVAVQSSTTRWIYALDSIGVRSASGTGGINSWNNNVSFTIGSTSEGYYVPANTKISNVLVYNRALTATEVLQNYNATKTRFGL